MDKTEDGYGYSGANTVTETQEDRDAYVLQTARAGLVPAPHTAKYETVQQDPPKVVAKDRAIPMAFAVFVIGVTGSLAAVLPIASEWLPAIGVIFAAINAAFAYWYRAKVEGAKDQARAEKV